MKVKSVININTSPESLWIFIANPENLPKWISQIKRVEILNQNFNTTGVKANITIVARGHKEEASLNYVGVNRPDSIQFLVNSDNVFAKLDCKLTEVAQGVKLAVELDFELDGLAARFVKLPQSMLDKQAAIYIGQLKREIES